MFSTRYIENNKYLICLLMFKRIEELHLSVPKDHTIINDFRRRDSYNSFYVHLGHDIIKQGYHLEWNYIYKTLHNFESNLSIEYDKKFDKERFIEFIRQFILSKNNKYIEFIKTHCDITKKNIIDILPLLDNEYHTKLVDAFLNDNELTLIQEFCNNNYGMKPSYLSFPIDIGCFSKNIKPCILVKSLVRIALDLGMIVYGETAINNSKTYTLRMSSDNNIYEYANILNILFQFSANIKIYTYVSHSNYVSLGHTIKIYFDNLVIEIIIINKESFNNHKPFITTFSLAKECINGKDHIYSLIDDVSPFEIMKLAESNILKLNHFNNILSINDFYNIIDLFYNISVYLSQGWKFDGLPFNITNYITYNIDTTILEDIFNKDVSSIIIDYIGIKNLTKKTSCKHCDFDTCICVIFRCCQYVQCVKHALKDIHTNMEYIFVSKMNNIDSFKCINC